MERHTLRGAVLDSSIIVKWFAAEPDSDDAVALRKYFLTHQLPLIAPDLAIYEVANSLAYNPRYTTDTIQLAIHTLLQFGIEFTDPDEDIISHAISIAKLHKLSVYDAAYAALAEIKVLPLITADRALLASSPHALSLEMFKKHLS